MQINIHEAKVDLPALLEAVRAGEEVVIAEAGKPVARLSAITPGGADHSGVQFGGLDMQALGLSADFYAPLTDDDLVGD